MDIQTQTTTLILDSYPFQETVVGTKIFRKKGAKSSKKKKKK